MTQYYMDGSRERQAEIDMCLVYNLSNNYIDTVHLLLEKATGFDEAKFNHPKIRIHLIGKRLDYKTALEYANAKLAGRICILANCDIYFDHTLSRITPQNLIGKMFALSRYDVKSCGTVLLNLFLGPVSQDAWIFISPVTLERMNVDFNMGLLGCDNRISFEFSQAGYTVINPCFPRTGIVVRHLHQSEKRNYSPTTKVAGGYLPVMPMDEFG